jgi:hypothetical protein
MNPVLPIFGPGLPAVSFILDEAASPCLIKAALGRAREGGIRIRLHFPTVVRRLPARKTYSTTSKGDIFHD